MATMTFQMPDGSSQSMTVDDALKEKSPAEQSAFVDDARKQAIAKRAQQAPTAAAPAAPADNGYANDVGSGLSGLESSARATARLADHLPDGTPGKAAIAGFGHGAQVLPQPANYQPAGDRLTGALRDGRYGDALAALPHAAVQSLPGMVPAIAAGSVAGPVGAAAVLTAQNAGQNVEARQAANGNATPSTGDLAGGIGTAALQGVIGAGGLNPASIPGVGTALGRLSAPARAAVGVGTEAAAGGANSAVGQLGTSVGTAQGAHLDPAEVASAAIQQGAGRAATLAPGLAKAGVKEGVDNAMSRAIDQPATLQDAQSIGRVRTQFKAAEDQATATRGDTAPTAVLNNVKSELQSNLLNHVGQLREDGYIDSAEARTLRTVIQDQALRHNNTIAEGGEHGPSTLFDAVNKLRLPDAALEPITNAIRDLNTVSSQSFLKNQTGPFQQIGSVLGNVGSFAGAAYSMNPVAMMGAVAGHGLAGRIGALGGKALDNLFGGATPSVLLRARAADRMMKAAGVDEGPSSIEGLQNASAAMQDVSGVADPVARARKLAEIHAAMADRVAVGNPARDPVPVNTPLPAQGAPQDPTGAPPAAPTPPPVGVPPEPAQAPPAPAQVAPEALAGWRRYVANGHDLTPAAIEAAVGKAVADGKVAPGDAQALIAHPGGHSNLPMLRAVQGYLGTGQAGPNSRAQVGLPPEGYRGPIHDAEKYGQATDQYQGHAADKMALAAGDTGLQATVLNIRDTKSGADKARLASEYIARQSGPKRELAEAVLSGPLLASKVP